jgi:hypothetical protein
MLWKDTASLFVVGVHFTAEDLYKFGANNKIMGRSLWALGLDVLCSLKNAIDIVPKLEMRIIVFGNICAFVGHALGKC